MKDVGDGGFGGEQRGRERSVAGSVCGGRKQRERLKEGWREVEERKVGARVKGLGVGGMIKVDGSCIDATATPQPTSQQASKTNPSKGLRRTFLSLSKLLKVSSFHSLKAFAHWKSFIIITSTKCLCYFPTSHRETFTLAGYRQIPIFYTTFYSFDSPPHCFLPAFLLPSFFPLTTTSLYSSSPSPTTSSS